ncbi:MAG: DUF2079 domain-containing protein [Nostocaceae cyanobacterium]|nr:DUF2079 domain-containing protein [Nostocaceae cyanobacterium]
MRLAIISAIAFFTLTLIFTLHRYYTFYASFDQGIFNQIFWNSSHGRLFESSLSSSLSSSTMHDGAAAEVYYRHLGQHFNPIFLLWLPVYALFPANETLIFLQVALVTGAGLVLYTLAREYLQPQLAAIITVSFYCANTVIGPTLSNFHDISATPLLIFALLLAMEKRQWWWFSILTMLLLGVREDTGVAVFSVGFYMLASKRYPKIGIAVCVLSFAYMLVLTQKIMPLFSPDVSQRMMIERFGQYASGKEATPSEIIWAIVSNPGRLLQQVFSPFDKKFKYLLGHWLPLAFVPAISPAAWFTAGLPILYIFLQRGESPLAITIRYAMPVVPGLFYGAIIWWSSRQELFQQSWVRRFWAICLSLSLIFTLTSNPNRTFYFLMPDSVSPWVFVSLPQQWQHVTQVLPLLQQIPPSASVSATTYLIPQLSGRREVIRLLDLELKNDQRQVVKVDYAIADMKQLQIYQAAFKGDRHLLQELVKLIDKITNSQEYGIIGFQDGVILLQKATKSQADATAAWLGFRQQLALILQKPI